MKKAIIFLLIMLSSTGMIYGQAPAWSWVAKAGGTGDDAGHSTTIDNNGNIIVAGYFNGTINFGPYTLISSGASDFFITKYDPTGNLLWARKGGGSLNDQITSLTTDPWGNIVVTGAFQSTTIIIDSISLSNSGSWDAFVAAFDPQGNVQWANQIIGADHDNANCVIADSNSIVIGGRFKQNVIVGTDTLTNVSSGTYAFDIFLVKYDRLGNVVWSKSSGGVNEDEITSLSFDNNGDILATGSYVNSSISFDTISLSNSGSNDIFLTKYNSSGDVLWAKKAAGTFSDHAYALTVDQNNNPIITGYFGSSKIYFDSDSLINIGGSSFDIFIAKYDHNGNVVWIKRTGNMSMNVGYALVADDNNNIFIAGNYEYLPFYFAADTLVNKGGWDIFLAKYDEFGNELWAKAAAGSDYDEVQSNSLSIAPDGSIALTGWFYSDTISFDSISLVNTNAGNPSFNTRDIFLAVLSPNAVGTDVSTTERVFDDITLFPNPSEESINIISSSPIQQVKIFNSAGQLLTIKNVDGQRNVSLTIERNGIYFVQIMSSNQTMTKKVIIRK